MATYQEFSKQIKEKYPEYKNVDDLKLAKAMIEKYPVYKDKVTFDSKHPQEPIKAGISMDITPSGIVKKIDKVGENIGAALAAPIVANINKTSVQDAFNKNIKKINEYNKQKASPMRDFAIDTLGYSLIPVSRATGLPGFVSNVARFGALPGALEGLKNGVGDSIKGALGGSAIAGGIMAGIPVVGNVAKQAGKLLPNAGGTVAKTLGRLNPKTLEVATKPGSKALDLTPEQAQNLLMNTTERVRADYNQLLSDKGNQVGQLLGNLPEGAQMRTRDLLQDYDKIYNNYSLSKNAALNPARNATTKEMAKIEELLGENTVSPKELYDINKNVSNMVDWNKADSALKNEVLEQIYGSNAEKIANLSPELKEANKAYSDLMDFQKNEGIRRILNNSNNIDTASSALKNYNSTVTKGNTNRNIQDLEKKLVDNGYGKFLNDIDDVNAAMDLNNIRTTGDSFWANVGTQLARPILRGARAYNSSNLPVLLQNIGNVAGNVARRVLPAAFISMPPLQAGVTYNEYN